jgi:hypothetical protein
MLHKISQFCDKIDSIKKKSDELRVMKYGNPKALVEEINNTIADIQYQCLLLANDKSNYETIYEENGLPKDFTDKFKIDDEGGV